MREARAVVWLSPRRRLLTFHSWPDLARGGRYVEARGWWFRFGGNGPGLHYRNVSHGGLRPLFRERYGRDGAVSVRVGPHVVKLLRGYR